VYFFAGSAGKENLPSMSVLTPPVCPSTVIDTPASGSMLALVTLPTIFPGWAVTITTKPVRKKQKSRIVFATTFFLVAAKVNQPAGGGHDPALSNYYYFAFSCQRPAAR
jgi:hypothetical protein